MQAERADSADVTSRIEDGALQAFLVRQRWFGGKARPLRSARFVDAAALVNDAWLTLIEVQFQDGGRDRYLLPLAVGRGSEATKIQEQHPHAIVARLEDDDVVYDGLFHDGLCLALLDAIERGGEIATQRARLRGNSVEPSRRAAGPVRIRRTAPDQSNTSVIFGSALIMKMFRRVEGGINPDVELSTFLTRRGFTHVPATIGTLEYVDGGVEPASMLMLQQFVPNRGNGWEVAVAGLTGYFSNADEPVEGYLQMPELLGRRTGELHMHLASGDDPAFVPEPYAPEDLDRLASAMRARAEAQLQLLRAGLPQLDAGVRRRAEQVLAAAPAVVSPFDQLRRLEGAAARIRCHGDYHLGQTLVTSEDIVILDFEGEPARPLDERRAKSSPLRDVAGMLRSFSYAAVTALRAGAGEAPAGATDAAARADNWEQAAQTVFIRAYLDATHGATFLPAGRADFDTLLRAFTMDKAAYELGYELNNRPDWIDIPLTGLLRLVAGGSGA